ncbi:MAG TPA: hypothetical protein VK629_04780 [Steroidobacteraceae bacterium]|nr:hypothetical protein [Steroidobacteraceae bacterium]
MADEARLQEHLRFILSELQLCFLNNQIGGARIPFNQSRSFADASVVGLHSSLHLHASDYEQLDIRRRLPKKTASNNESVCTGAVRRF